MGKNSTFRYLLHLHVRFEVGREILKTFFLQFTFFSVVQFISHLCLMMKAHLQSIKPNKILYA
jgi:hypothetical protein